MLYILPHSGGLLSQLLPIFSKKSVSCQDFFVSTLSVGLKCPTTFQSSRATLTIAKSIISTGTCGHSCTHVRARAVSHSDKHRLLRLWVITFVFCRVFFFVKKKKQFSATAGSGCFAISPLCVPPLRPIKLVCFGFTTIVTFHWLRWAECVTLPGGEFHLSIWERAQRFGTWRFRCHQKQNWTILVATRGCWALTAASYW